MSLVPPHITTITGLARHRLQTMTTGQLVIGDHRFDSEALLELSAAVAGIDADPLQPIAVLTRHDADGLLVLLAAMASGRPLVPLSVEAAPDLIASRIRASGCRAVLIGPGLEESAEMHGLPVIASDASGSSADLIEPDPDGPSIICFTSGSTGEPRCFARTQAGLFLVGIRRFEARGLPQGYRQLVCMSTLFVGVVNNIAQILAGGGSTRMFAIAGRSPDEIRRVILEDRINYLALVPTLMRELMLVSGEHDLDSVHSINVSGELMTRSDVLSWLESLPSTVQLQVSYGSTESGTLTIHRVNESDCTGDEPIGLGCALPGVEMLVLDGDGRPCPSGVPGWVHVRSAHEVIPCGLDPVPLAHVAVEEHGEGWFPMGDRGVLDADGVLVVFGRADGEIKLGGVRFDPGACEALIRTLDVVDDATIVVPEQHGEPLPVAFVITAAEHREPVRTLISDRFPGGRGVRLEIRSNLPSTSTGKRDRKALLSEARTLLLNRETDAVTRPRSPVEEVIQNAWITHLRVQDPPVDRTFFELGGNSLQLLSVVLALKEHYGIELPTERLGELDTIRKQGEAAYLQSSDDRQEPIIT